MTNIKTAGRVVAITLIIGVLAMLMTACFGSHIVISFQANGGTPCDSIEVESGVESIDLPTPTKEGYDFVGWYSDASFGTLVKSPLTGDNIPTAGVTFYAKWTVKKFSISFVREDTDEVLFVKEYEYGKKFTEKDLPSLSGQADSLQWKYPGDFTVTASRTIYAKPDGSSTPGDDPVIEKTCTVTYYVPSESVYGKYDVYVTCTGKVGVAISVPADPIVRILPEESGDSSYKAIFSGWYYDDKLTSACTSAPTAIPEDSVSLYAKYVVMKDDSKLLYYEYITEDTVRITGLTVIGSYQSSVSIPSEIEGKTVVEIGKAGMSRTGKGSLYSEFMETVIIPETVKEINSWAFTGCSALRDVKCAGNNMTYIGDGAFAGCVSIETFILPDYVTGIGKYVFAGKDFSEGSDMDAKDVDMKLRELVIGAEGKLSGIGDYAFYNCKELKQVTLGPIMNEFNHLAFYGSGLERIDVHSGGAMKGIDGVLYSRTGTTLYYYPEQGEAVFSVPVSVVNIAPYAFYKNMNITSVIASNKLSTIGEYAFAYCEKMSECNLANTALTSIGNSAFIGDKGLLAASFPKSLKILGEKAFFGCEELTSATFAGAALEVLEKSVFENCAKLKSINVPAGVTEIKDYAFCGCGSMRTLTFAVESELKRIGNYAFYECKNVGSVLLPTTLAYVGDYAFSCAEGRMQFDFDNDTDLRSLAHIGVKAFANSGVAKIALSGLIASNSDLGEMAFANCTSLKQASFSRSGYDALPYGLFMGCTELTRIIFSDNILTIGDSAFYGCSAIEWIEFGESITVIEDDAFNGCEALTNQGGNRRVLPVNLTYLGKNAFYNCKSLESVNIPKNLEYINEGVFAHCEALTSINYDDGASVDTIKTNAFAYCTSLVQATLPGRLKTREEGGLVGNPFFGCSSLTTFSLNGVNDNGLYVKDGVVCRKLINPTTGTEAIYYAIYAYPTAKSSSSYAVPAGVAEIDPYAFCGSTITGLTFAKSTDPGIESVTFVSVGDWAFAETNITGVILSYRVYEVGEYAFYKSKLGGSEGEGKEGRVEIDEMFLYDGIDGYNITNITETLTCNALRIGDYAFSEIAITEIVVPRRVTNIGEGAFSCDYSLASVGFSGGDLPSEYNDLSLILGDKIFENDNLITEIVIPSYTEYVGSGAFSECRNLKTVTFGPGGGKGLTIGDYAFSKVHYLYEITFPKTIIAIGEGIFEGDTRLKVINFPSELTVGSSLTLPNGMFEGVTTLEEITIPEYVTKIGDNAFVGTSLKKVTFLGNIISPDLEIGNDTFYGLTTLEEITLPDNLVRIGERAFAYSAIKSVNYAEGKDIYIDDEAFKGTLLPEITLTERVQVIGKASFADIQTLQSLTFVYYENRGVTEISENAFSGDENLQEVILGSGIRRIGDNALKGTAIESLDFVNVCEIGEFAVADTPLQAVSLYTSNPIILSKNALKGTIDLASVKLISEKDITVGEFAISGCAKLNDLQIIGKTVTLGEGFAMGTSALGENITLRENDTENANYYFDEEEKVVYSSDGSSFVFYPAGKEGSIFHIDGNITTICDYAFYGCTGLTAIVVHNDDVDLTELSIKETTDNLRIFVPVDLVNEYSVRWGIDIVEAYKTVAQGFILTLKSTGDYEISEYLGGEEDIVIDGIIVDAAGEEETTYTVTDIGDNAFRNNTVIKTVVIGSGIKTVSNGAFQNCSNLTAVTLGENVAGIKSYAFYNCPKLHSVTFKESGLISIGNYAFAEDPMLLSFDVPTSTESIGIFAFAGDRALSEVTLGNVESIGNNAFENCVSLSRIELPASVAGMGNYVFSGCVDLVYINMVSDSVCKIETNTFTGIPENMYFFVPSAFAAKKYKSDAIWRKYVSKILSAENRCTVPGYENYVIEQESVGYKMIAYLGDEEDIVLNDPSIGEEGVIIASIGEFAIGKFVKTVKIYDGLVYIYDKAFSNAINLKSISLPATLRSIGSYAFANLDKLDTVTIESEEASYSIEIGSSQKMSLIDKPSDEAVYNSKTGQIENFYGEATVKISGISQLTSIGSYAFYGCYSLTSITFPESLRTIGEFAFAAEDGRTMNLTEVNFQHDTKIDKESEYQETEIRSTFYFRSVDSEGRYTYYKYDYAETVDIAIGKYAFAGNNLLRNVKFDCHVSALGEGAFANCTRLEIVYFNYLPKTVTDAIVPETSAKGAFENCYKVSVIIPNTAVNSRFSRIWTNEFDKHKLTEKMYVINDYVYTNMGSGNLTVINYIGDDTEVSFPSSVTIERTKYNVTRLGRQSYGTSEDINGYVIGDKVTKITVPQTITVIGDGAFRNSPSLTAVYFAGNSLRTIEPYAFAGCQQLETITLPISIEDIRAFAFYDCDKLDYGEGKFSFVGTNSTPSAPNLSIQAYAFAECDSLTNFHIVNRVGVIGGTASNTNNLVGHTFDGCSNLKVVTFAGDALVTAIRGYTFAGTAITEIALPKTVENLAERAFANAYDLVRVIVQREVGAGAVTITSPGEDMFDGIDNDHIKVYVPESNYELYKGSAGWKVKTIVKNLVTEDGNFAYDDLNDRNFTVKLTDYRGMEEELVIPQTVKISGEYYTVTSIGAYFGNKKIKKVSFATNSGVTTLEDYAFAGCVSLEQNRLTDAVTSIGAYAFMDCARLTDVRLSEHLAEIKEFTFYRCASLKEITLTREITAIGASAFYGCTSLSRVIIEFGDVVRDDLGNIIGGEEITSANASKKIGNSAFGETGKGVGGLAIIVPSEKVALFRGWTEVKSNIYALSDKVGDFLVTSNNDDTLTMVQYLGNEKVLDLRTLMLKGKRISKVELNAVDYEKTKLKFDEIRLGDYLVRQNEDDSLTLVQYYGEGSVDLKSGKIMGMSVVAIDKFNFIGSYIEYGDFTVELYSDGTATLIEYRGNAQFVDLTDLIILGYPIGAIDDGIEVSGTIFIVDDEIVYSSNLNKIVQKK